MVLKWILTNINWSVLIGFIPVAFGFDWPVYKSYLPYFVGFVIGVNLVIRLRGLINGD